MKSIILLPLASLLLASATSATAQSRIYRCGNSYTNDAAEARARDCKLVEGGNVTVVEGTRVQAPPAAATTASARAQPVVTAPRSAPDGAVRVASPQQQARDTEARAILEAELKKAEARHADLLKEWNNGEPEKIGPEHRNYQKYLDRVAELKASIARNENDIAGLKRELARHGGGTGAAAAR